MFTLLLKEREVTDYNVVWDTVKVAIWRGTDRLRKIRL